MIARTEPREFREINCSTGEVVDWIEKSAYDERTAENEKLKAQVTELQEVISGKTFSYPDELNAALAQINELKVENARLKAKEMVKELKDASDYYCRNWNEAKAERDNLAKQNEKLKAALIEAKEHFDAIRSGLTTDINRVEFETKKRAHEASVEIFDALQSVESEK